MGDKSDIKMIDQCFIEATVPTGFEDMAAEELSKKLKTMAARGKGKISFSTDFGGLQRVCLYFRSHVMSDVHFKSNMNSNITACHSNISFIENLGYPVVLRP